jgi:hypothetical protein
MMQLRALPLAVFAAGSVLAPAAHAVDRGAGLSCGLFTTGRTHQQGIVTGGPFVVANEIGGEVTSVTVTCDVQINVATYGSPVSSATTTLNGNVGLVESTVSFDADFRDNVWICTTVAWQSAKGGGSVNLDFDVAPGTQCALGTTTGPFVGPEDWQWFREPSVRLVP